MGFWEVLVIKSFLAYKMGISLDSWHKRRKTGGKRPQPHKKRKYQLGRPASMTKIGAKRVHLVRTRGGNTKFRGLRMDTKTSLGALKQPPEKPVSLMLCTTPATMSFFVPKP